MCEEFKILPMKSRKELITKAGRCYRCLAGRHLIAKVVKGPDNVVSKDAKETINHSPYLHETTPSDQIDRSNDAATGASLCAETK